MATGNKALPVAAVTIPMMSLVSPVIAGGFEFAVIEDDGDVMFHSDPQRNTHENLFEETDQNRRLRAAVEPTSTSISICCTQDAATVPM